jgi:uncharacterized protein (DUF983 family)
MDWTRAMLAAIADDDDNVRDAGCGYLGVRCPRCLRARLENLGRGSADGPRCEKCGWKADDAPEWPAVRAWVTTGHGHPDDHGPRALSRLNAARA